MTDWFIAYTTSSGERLAAEDLEGFGFQVFLPVEVVTLRPARHKKDRTKRTVSRPLFPRYLFVGFKPGWHDFARARMSKRVQDFIRDTYGSPVMMSAAAIGGIMDDCANGKYDEAQTKAAKEAARIKALIAQSASVKPGQTFTMRNGLFKGFLATVTRVREKEIRVQVENSEGASLSLDVPILRAEEVGIISPLKGDSKNGAR